jgi:hypothetical protein
MVGQAQGSLDMMDLLGTLIGGPLFGIVGSVVTNVIGSFQEAARQKREYDHIEKMTAMNAKFKAEEAEADFAVAQVDNIGQAISDSYTHDASYGEVSGWAVAALRFVRPLLTFLLIGIVTYFYITGSVEQEKIVVQVLFLSEMAVTWWFVDRRIKGR